MSFTDDEDDGSGRTAVRSDPLLGVMLGDYRVLERIGEGAMGVVYRGEHPVIGRPVAIKLLKPEFSEDPDHVRRFLEEARSVSAARHPGIIDVFSFGQLPGGRPWLVMELLEGESLETLLKDAGRLAPADAVALFIPMLQALSAAHAAGVIHRDLKPANIFIVRLADGTTFPKLLDFGLARRGAVGGLVRQTSIAGTPLYIAPEQARGDLVGPQTDLYSFGCIAWEVLTGTPPFNASNLSALLDAHASLAPGPLRPLVGSIPPELERLVLQLLEKDPAARPASAKDVRERLERLQAKLRSSQASTRVLPAQRAAVVRASGPRPKLDDTPARATQIEPVVASKTPLVAGIAVAVVALAVAAGVVLTREQPVPPPAPVEPVQVTPPVVDVPEPVDPPDTPSLAPGPIEPAKPRRRMKDVKRKREELLRRVQALPDSLRRAAETQLDDAGECRRAPDACWTELVDIEATFFPKAGGP